MYRRRFFCFLGEKYGMGAVFECIPNVSEGRRWPVVELLAEAVRSVAYVRLLDYSADYDHNRSVFTFVGERDALEEAVLNLFAVAEQNIDMHNHTGLHPRIGAIDVVPFVPLESASMAEASALAERVASLVAERFQVPIYLYGESARQPQRASLAYLRRGGWEALNKESLQGEERRPDLGPIQLHSKLGASCFGARGPLVAFNVWLNTQDVTIAKKIAAKVRASSGGLSFVKALGLELSSQKAVQVSMNLTNPKFTSIYTAFELVKIEARRFGVGILKSELIGCLPLQAMSDCFSYYLQMPDFTPQRTVESGLLELYKSLS